MQVVKMVHLTKKKNLHCTSEDFILDPEDYNDSQDRGPRRKRPEKIIRNSSVLQVSKERESLYRVFSRDLQQSMFCGYQYGKRHQTATSNPLLLKKQYFQYLLGLLGYKEGNAV